MRDLEARLGEALAPFQAAVDRVMTIPAVEPTVARVIVAEIGFDMSRFPTAGHLISWAGLGPRQQESAGKRLSTRTRPGNPWLPRHTSRGRDPDADLKHLFDWSYDDLEQEVRANLVYRAFTRIDARRGAGRQDHSEDCGRAGPDVIAQWHRQVVEVAKRAG